MSKHTFLCRHETYTDNSYWTETVAYDAEDAASEHAEYLFNQSDGWEYMPNNSTPILVKDDKSKSVRRFLVYVEFYPRFSASEAA